MPLVNFNPDDVQEPQVVPEGRYDLRIVGGETKKTKRGDDYSLYSIAIENPPPGIKPQVMRHAVFAPPSPGDLNSKGEPVEDWQIESSRLALVRFYDAFSLDYDGEPVDHIGAEAENVYLEVDSTDEGTPFNKLRPPKSSKR